LPDLPKKKRMDKEYIEDEHFTGIDYTSGKLPGAEYENCRFINCNFSSQDLSKINFTGCEFSGCNLSLATLHKTAFRDARFKDCKLLGLHFDACHDILFSVMFDNCVLNLSSFYKRKLKNTRFINSTMQEVDFTEADLGGALFENCDLSKTVFDNTILDKADFRSAFNYSIDPERNRLKKARFSVPGVTGLLDKYDIVIDH
jgi:uncharacterized protein YjbI with pentapeptide repeats